MSPKRFISFWLFSAGFVSFLRFFHATDLGYDLTLQIQAAQNLLKGNGLSIYALGGEDDLITPSKLETLTHFPAGYSLCAAGLLAMGLSVAMLVKIGGVVGTIFGWWGWARLAYSFLGDGMKRGFGWRLTGTVIAIFTPLFFTPPWGGTDIFLWAAVPWILAWVIKAADQNKSGGLWFDVLAGAACGACVLMRYASMFLALYAGFLIVCQSKNHLQTLLRRGAAFATGLFPFLALQFYLNHFVAVAASEPGGLTLKRGVGLAAQYFWNQSSSLTSANFLLVSWFPAKLMKLLIQPVHQAPWLLGITVAVFALPALLAQKLKSDSLAAAARDIRPAAAGLFVALPVFLWACAIFGVYYVGVIRYYQPLLPLAVFIAYAFAVKDRGEESKWASTLSTGGVVYLSGYLCMLVSAVTLLMLPGELRFGRRVKLMGTAEFRPWPSMAITYEFSPARRWVLDLLKQEADTVLVTNREHWFYADPNVDRSRLHRLERMQASYVSGPTRILILASDPEGAPADALYWFTSHAKPRRVRYFETLPDLRLIRTFPEENIKILEARVPTGSRIALNKQPPE